MQRRNPQFEGAPIVNIRRPILAAAAVPVVVLGATAGLAFAQDDGTAPPEQPGARVEFVCTNLARIQELQADHAALAADGLALLGDARAAAEAAGEAKAVERVERRIERVSERQGRIAERQEKLTTWAGEHC
jgi:predicted naringenin-chalcone synthase